MFVFVTKVYSLGGICSGANLLGGESAFNIISR